MKKNLISLTTSLFIITICICIITECISYINNQIETTEITKTEMESTTETEVETEFEPSYYPLLMQVTEIEGDIITATDQHGSSWQFISDDADIGDLYSCIMYDNGTEELEYHTIEKMRYSGHALDFITEVESCDTTETGVMINFSNGTGYYIEYN